jgi:hypothetical protein
MHIYEPGPVFVSSTSPCGKLPWRGVLIQNVTISLAKDSNERYYFSRRKSQNSESVPVFNFMLAHSLQLCILLKANNFVFQELHFSIKDA